MRSNRRDRVSDKKIQAVKRAFDLLLAFVGLIIFSPLLLLAAILIKIDSKGPAFFWQERVGKDFRIFRICKLRTMHDGNFRDKTLLTRSGDKRVTRLGRILRKYKIDELPQLINVLKGEMSFVGPRPEVKRYVDAFGPDYSRLLMVRPGITDPASVFFSNEEELLTGDSDLEGEYIRNILPRKIELSCAYLENMGLLTDMRIIFKTLSNVWAVSNRKGRK